MNNSQILSRSDFDELSAIHAPLCVSIYIPTHQYGEGVRERLDVQVLKTQIKKAYQQLESRGMAPGNIPAYLQQIESLLEDRAFWEHQWNGLALFLSEDHFSYHKLPVSVDADAIVGTHFYLRPLIPILNGQGRFYLLILTLNEVELFEGTQYQLTKVPVEDITPQKLEEVVGYDYRETFLQFRTGQSGMGVAGFHGHGEGKDDRKIEVTKFCRAVNKGLQSILHDATYPMVVSAVDYVFSLYQQVNTYQHMSDQHISGNPESYSLEELHSTSWEIVAPTFNNTFQEKINLFHELSQTMKTSSDLRDILSASMNGRVDTLFVMKGKEIWGTYHLEKNILNIESDNNLHNDALVHHAVIQTLQHGGMVYERSEDDMPERGVAVNALFRY